MEKCMKLICGNCGGDCEIITEGSCDCPEWDTMTDLSWVTDFETCSTLGAKFGPSLVNKFSGPSDSSIRQGWYQSDAGDPDSIYNNPSSNINYSSGKLINDPFGNDSVYGGTTTEWNTDMPAEIYTPNTSQGIFSSDNIMNIFNRGKTTFR